MTVETIVTVETTATVEAIVTVDTIVTYYYLCNSAILSIIIYWCLRHQVTTIFFKVKVILIIDNIIFMNTECWKYYILHEQ